MRRFWKTLTFACLWTIVAAGCTETDEPFYNGTGTLRIIIEPQGIEGQALPAAEDFRLLLSTEDGETAIWTKFSDFDQNRRYLAGNYELKAIYGSELDEGFDKPYYVGSTKFHLNEGENNTVVIKPRQALANVIAQTNEIFLSAWPGAYITFNSQGGLFIDYPSVESPTVYLKPGRTTAYLNLPYKSQIVTLMFDHTFSTLAGVTTMVTLEGNKDEAILKVDGQTIANLSLNEDILQSPEPKFNIPFNEILLPEYVDNLASSIVSVDCALRSLTMTISPTIPGYNEILSFEGNELSLQPYLESLGWTEGGTNKTCFTFVATTFAGRVAISPTLSVTTLPATPKIVDINGALMGDNSLQLTIESDLELNSSKLALASEGKNIQILNCEFIGEKKWLLKANLPEGESPIEVTLSYGSRIIQTLTIPRVSPRFDARIDAFASKAKIQIIPENPNLLGYIVSNLNIAIDGTEASILSVDSETGLITIIGLSPERQYICSMSLLPLNLCTSDSKLELEFKTEKSLAIPNGDFEDAYDDINCQNMNCGGAYSQTFAEIFNQQNTTSYTTKSPKGWANVNSKTYCESATNRNTWYMQPSTLTTLESFSGDRAVELISVAYDPNGEKIPPYLQESRPYTNYSRIIPQISYRAAGKIFLGQYSYNPKSNTEIYKEGIDFFSRPTSLNGYYKFLPAPDNPTDQALIKIEFFNGEEIICEESIYLPVATDFTSFTVPLTFLKFGKKATQLKLMVASSKDIGSIEYETKLIKTIDDPVTSTSKGSRLIIDNLNFAY